MVIVISIDILHWQIHKSDILTYYTRTACDACACACTDQNSIILIICHFNCKKLKRHNYLISPVACLGTTTDSHHCDGTAQHGDTSVTLGEWCACEWNWSNMVQSCPIHHSHLDTSLTPLTPRNLKNKQLRLAPRPTEANGAAGWLKDAWKFSNSTGNHYDRPLMSNHIIQ